MSQLSTPSAFSCEVTGSAGSQGPLHGMLRSDKVQIGRGLEERKPASQRPAIKSLGVLTGKGYRTSLKGLLHQPNKMLIIKLSLFALLAAAVPFSQAFPVGPGSSGDNHPVLPGQGIDLDLNLAPPISPRLGHLTDAGVVESTGLESALSRGAASSSSDLLRHNTDHFLIPFPVVRRDVAKALLSLRFGISSNEPVETILNPVERLAARRMGSDHIHSPHSTWLHAVVDEPQHDLTYKRQLYVAAPIANHDWRSSFGVPLTRGTSDWLPIVFYKAGIEPDQRNTLRLAGVEVVKNMEDARKVLQEW
ncbi:hypothetical protein PANT_15c00063 [Moesziomyces antarcticus T-34]|uniref:Uncharacterized protein n=1 Tax=Pseudozyma antarctica (strain T-34) TaxID=1151754 RepID=M9M4P4_PSEA3|nr:hypothetical protein PANT_15c00063 [Moesziomyces antarcticus T-34]